MLVSDLLAFAMRTAGVLGVGQVALVEDSGDALASFVMMLKQWDRKRWLNYRLDDFGCPAVPGKQAYLIGPDINADINTYRRSTLEGGYMRQLFGSGPASMPIDYPLFQITTLQEWSSIALKNLQSWPSAFYYDPALPIAAAYIWPIPMQPGFEFHFLFRQSFDPLVLTSDTLDFMPQEYEEAALYNLAARLRVQYALPSNPDLNAIARASLATVRSTNFAVQRLHMPAALGRGRTGRIKNPMGGFVETSVGIPFTPVGP